MLEDLNTLVVPVIFLEGKSISPSEAKSPECQFLVTKYPPDLEEFLVVPAEEIVSINVFNSDIDYEVVWRFWPSWQEGQLR